ncbi:short chain dehydrogenase reductase [Grosmannia clavigera kw1407]|uniref:Short chain dehydrogenase reductase n=1 Tax=Grosmannia clavigera (strain kw1407 / UAMH 11150) TaxID=655863 RepID=F0XHV5_GROCL|nr:short chain dehydrogenase reductase [Grosmannia clavigera kw1407]EFX03322.1 short chain dehydrogenase reductase [Grosmannia clavigera kw1407]
MPLPFLATVAFDGLPAWMPQPWTVAQAVGSVGALAAIKYYASGATNDSERKMHGRVVLITGGTSGIGAVVAYEMARRGASLVLLTAQAPSDPMVIDYIGELRERTDNQLIYAEQADLASLHSIRTFATRWIDSLPPRRLDMVILCAAVEPIPLSGGAQSRLRGATTPEGIEGAWMVNYLANFHLLGLLSPALRSQPFDRDVRVIITTCSAYIGAPPLMAGTLSESEPVIGGKGGKGGKAEKATAAPTATVAEWTPKRAYARSKLALMVFARSFQKHVDAYERPDKLPGNVRVLLVDPGLSRTPGMRRWLTGGSLLWLVLGYVLLYPLWWLLVKSADMGAQSVLFASMEAQLRRLQGLGSAGGSGSDDSSGNAKVGEPLAAEFENDLIAGKIIKECRLVDVARRDVGDEAVAKALWEESDRLVEQTEKRAAAQRRAAQQAEEAAKQAEEAAAKAKKEAEAEAAQKSEIAALVDAIKKGKKQAGKEKEAEAKATGAERKDDKKTRKRA